MNKQLRILRLLWNVRIRAALPALVIMGKPTRSLVIEEANPGQEEALGMMGVLVTLVVEMVSRAYL